ncbi:MAG: YihY/virulence factor BrkB family protein [Ruminococcaceae bacterium]|nr:YihY/virulence factor BrkB family protein [Oscillospiraceae bacterium]
MKRINKTTWRPTWQVMIKNIYRHNVFKSAAALAYYLLFALFPLLIFASNLLGLLNLNITDVTQSLARVLPTDVVAIAEHYLDYAKENSSHAMLWFSLVFSIWFPARAVRGLMDDVRRAYDMGRPQHPLLYIAKQFVYTLLFLVAIFLTLLLTVVGENVVEATGNLLAFSPPLLRLWQYLRFLPVGLLMYTTIGCLYSLATERRQRFKAVIPGILLALAAWLIISIGFSVYVENFAHYSAIYGTMGAVIVLLIWLYLSAVVLILGAEFNAALEQVQGVKKL